MFKKILALCVALISVLTLVAQNKKVIDLDAYSRWRNVSSATLSDDGRWVSYKYTYADNDEKNRSVRNVFYLYNTSTGKTKELKDVSDLKFIGGGKWLQLTDYKTVDSVKIGKEVFIRLKDNHKIVVPDSLSYSPVSDKSTLVTYSQNGGKDMVIFDISNNSKIIYSGVKRLVFYDDFKSVVYIKESEKENVIMYGCVGQELQHKVIFRDSTCAVKSFNFNVSERVGLFDISVSGVGKEKMFRFDLNTLQCKQVLTISDITLSEPLFIDRRTFNQNSITKYISFDVYSSRPKPQVKPKKENKDSSFELELWSWDAYKIPTEQKIGYKTPTVKPMKYVYNIENGAVTQVSDEGCEHIYFSSDKNSDFAFIGDDKPYLLSRDWTHENRVDYYMVDLRNGEKTPIIMSSTQKPMWSPKGDYLIYFDSIKRVWMVMKCDNKEKRVLSSAITHPVYNETHDKPNPIGNYGLSAWSADGYTVLLNDMYDIWAVDIRQPQKAYCYTSGYGRKNNISLRVINLKDLELTLDLTKPQELNGFDTKRMSSCYLTLNSNGRITKNIEGDFLLRIDGVSSDKRSYICSRQSFREPRDLWFADSKFRRMKRITNVNPQQSDYNWGNVEIVEWTAYDGRECKGLLYTPDGYEKGKSYPTIVNFYETHTHEKNVNYTPALSSAMLNLPAYLSRGYVIFMPDVYFEIGNPGKSSYNIVVSGVEYLSRRGVIDSTRVGLQGHSWSGYQTAYLVSQTDIFTCVNVGAPIVNMTAGYTGIREGSGLPRLFMYEDWQCRMGATLWEKQQNYIENSTIFYADKINTPLLLFHCDKDEAVSFYEGRNLFLALRRLQRPSWMLNYKGQGHFVTTRAAKRDWTKRMQQFFDYYLKNSAMPRWMSEGIDISERGYDQKFDFTE